MIEGYKSGRVRRLAWVVAMRRQTGDGQPQVAVTTLVVSADVHSLMFTVAVMKNSTVVGSVYVPAMVPTSHTTSPFWKVCGKVAVTNVTFEGKVSVTTTARASVSLLLVTVMSHWTVSPGSA